MKKNTKSSITLPPKEVALVEGLVKKLGAKSKVEVIRKGLQLLKSQTDRHELRAAYSEAAKKVEKVTKDELEDLDALTDEGLD